jgi:hypothetical protein
MNNKIETFEILNKTIENGYITNIDWLWLYSDENISSYTVCGSLICIDNGLVLDKNITDDTLLIILRNHLSVDSFRTMCYYDLGLNINN